MKGKETKGTMGIHSLNTNTSGSCELTVLISHQAVFETLNVIYDVDFEFKKENHQNTWVKATQWTQGYLNVRSDAMNPKFAMIRQ